VARTSFLPLILLVLVIVIVIVIDDWHSAEAIVGSSILRRSPIIAATSL